MEPLWELVGAHPGHRVTLAFQDLALQGGQRLTAKVPEDTSFCQVDTPKGERNSLQLAHKVRRDLHLSDTEAGWRAVPLAPLTWWTLLAWLLPSCLQMVVLFKPQLLRS